MGAVGSRGQDNSSICQRCAVMQRLTMRMDEATFEHPGVPEGHPLRTHCSYRLSQYAWRSSPPGTTTTVTLISGGDRL